MTRMEKLFNEEMTETCRYTKREEILRERGYKERRNAQIEDELKDKKHRQTQVRDDSRLMWTLRATVGDPVVSVHAFNSNKEE